MAHYVLHFPNQSAGNPELLRKAGVDHFDIMPEWQNGTGHEGKRGIIAGWKFGQQGGSTLSSAERLWHALPPNPDLDRKEGEVWIGTDVSNPVKPTDVLKANHLPGAHVTLCDKQDWYIPIAADIPQVGRINGLGKFERAVGPQYRDFYETALLYFSKLTGAINTALESKGRKVEDIELTFEAGYQFGWDALALNYRLTPEIATGLGLLDDVTLLSLISVVICRKDISDLAFKKKQCLKLPIL